MDKRLLAPIVLFVYNRQWHTMQTIEALKKNELADQSDLIIYSDGPKNEQVLFSVEEVRHYLKTITGFKSVKVIERDVNWGLAASIIDGVTEIVNVYGQVIVMEDDLITSPYFLRYMNEGLTLYSDEESVASIHGYIYPIEGLPSSFFIKGADCWGWATWKRAWDVFNPDGEFLLTELIRRRAVKEFDFGGSYGYSRMLKNQIKGKNNSWAVRWYASAFLAGKFTLYPGVSFVQNIGNDDTGTHCSGTSDFNVALVPRYDSMSKIEIKECLECKREMKRFFHSISSYHWKTVMRRLWGKIR